MKTYRIISDLHTEVWDFNPHNINKFERALLFSLPEDSRDATSTLLLAGDVATMNTLDRLEIVLSNLASRFKEVVYCAGNHEYWGGASYRACDVILCSISDKYGVRYSGTSMMDSHPDIVCGTMWTDYANGSPLVLMEANWAMNDYKNIKEETPESTYEMHKRFIADLSSRKDLAGKIVMTHHAPSNRSLNSRYPHGGEYYASPLDQLVEDLSPALWVHGHVHQPKDYRIGTTQIICNPHGYKGWESTKYKRKLFVEI